MSFCCAAVNVVVGLAGPRAAGVADGEKPVLLAVVFA
jgi:hypothetical protein